MRLLFLLSILITNIKGVRAQNHIRHNYGSSENQYYLALEPKSKEIKGALVLLPGFGQLPETIFSESKIPNVAYAHDILTIEIAGGPKLYADDAVVEDINEAMKHVMETYDLSPSQFVIGGFSAGGTLALRYTEYAYEKERITTIRPQGVFTVDSPVDLFEIWEYFERELEKGFSEVGRSEAQYVSDLMTKEIGTPKEHKATYDRLTPFSVNMKESGNEQYLKDIGVRVYHDIDVMWQLQNRRRSLFDSNALPASELINRLMLMGNDKAEFMQAKQPGVRSSGMRHTHSWSIVDETELVLWVEKLLED
ncbi:MAG: hypothetical protein ABJ004_15035 [Cyclobacteriaceae bacterium]